MKITIEDNESNVYKNDDTNLSIIFNKSLSEIDTYKIFGFSYNFKALKDDENDIDEKDLYFLKGGKTSTNQNQNQNRKKFKISTKKRERKKEIKLNKKRKEKSMIKIIF